MTSDIRDILFHLSRGEVLSEADATALFERVMRGELDDAQLASALTSIAARGPTVDELVGVARVMRSRAVAVPVRDAGLDPSIIVLDTCGTGGAPKTFNVSTAAAIVTAAAGRGKLVVAKHGGRSRTGRGSAETLALLGVNVDAPPSTQARCLRDVGVCFCFAVNHHPAMKHAAAVRKSLGFPTILNLVGPLANPAGATRQLIGTYAPDHALKLAHALVHLGTDRSIVVTSDDGMDELTTTAANIMHEAIGVGSTATRVATSIFDAASLGMPRAHRTALEVSSLEASAATIMSVLRGDHGAPRDLVTLNAGAALFLCGVASSIREGVDLAAAAVDTGAARATLDQLVRASKAA